VYNILSFYINILLSLYIFRNRRKNHSSVGKLAIVLLPKEPYFMHLSYLKIASLFLHENVTCFPV